MAILDVGIGEGQSNGSGFGSVTTFSPPGGLPAAGCPLYCNVNQFGTMQYQDFTVRALDTTTPGANPPYFGPECQLGLDLLAMGLSPYIIKSTANGTSVLQWSPADASQYWALMQEGLSGGHPRSAVDGIRFHLFSVRGEFEATDPDPTGANNYLTNYLTGIYQGVVDLLGGYRPAVHVCRVSSQLASAAGGAPNLATVRDQQSQLAIATGGYLINCDAIPNIGDFTHYTGPGLNTVGSLIARSIQASIIQRPGLFYL